MSRKRKAVDPKLVKIAAELFSARMAADRAYNRVRRAWRRLDKLEAQIRRLLKRKERREQELDGQEAPSEGVPS